MKSALGLFADSCRPLSRRQFLRTSAVASFSALCLPRLAYGAPDPAEGLGILILGGTGFLGPACTEAALARGHKVTHFNSGRTEERRTQAGRPSLVPAGVETLRGNRDPDKTADDRRTAGQPGAKQDPNSPRGLSQLKGRKWDAVIDTSGYFPRMVRASAELLAPNVRQYVFISSISVYERNDQPNYDESAPLRILSDPKTEEMGRNFENFGGGKALCEKAAEAAMPGRVTNIRPGYIVGPRDTSGRFIYWPVRVSMGGTMLVPGAPTDPIQIIDVRDLAEWIVSCIERNITGVFNATGPDKELSMQSMLEGIRTGVDAKTRFYWASLDALRKHGVGADRFALYAPPSGETAGFHRCNISRALRHGLRFRSVSDTARATLEWYRSLPGEIQRGVAPQFAKPEGSESWLEIEKRALEALEV